jgi:hypothetical protein
VKKEVVFKIIIIIITKINIIYYNAILKFYMVFKTKALVSSGAHIEEGWMRGGLLIIITGTNLI